MGRNEQDFFKKNSFVLMGNTRRMRNAFTLRSVTGKICLLFYSGCAT